MQDVLAVLATEIQDTTARDFQTEERQRRRDAYGEVERQAGLARSSMPREERCIAYRQPVLHDELRALGVALGKRFEVQDRPEVGFRCRRRAPANPPRPPLPC